MENSAKKIIDLGHELQALSTAGLQYSGQPFDRERYRRIREIAAEMVAAASGEPLEKVGGIFEDCEGYQTPKLSTRAAIFNEREEVLLVRDFDGKWVMPGGWCEYNETVFGNVKKEAWEEAGLRVEPYRLVGLFDHRKRNNPDSFFFDTHVFMLCRVTEGSFRENIETTESGYFALDALPELNEHKTSREQIRLCREAYLAEVWEPIVD